MNIVAASDYTFDKNKNRIFIFNNYEKKLIYFNFDVANGYRD